LLTAEKKKQQQQYSLKLELAKIMWHTISPQKVFGKEGKYRILLRDLHWHSIVTLLILTVYTISITVALDQTPHWRKMGKKISVGEKKKKIGERSEPRGSLGRGKGGALSPSPGHRWARFAGRYFSYLTPARFCTFFSHCGAWSQAIHCSITVQNILL